jgi:DnaJ-class molecular chaperone
MQDISEALAALGFVHGMNPDYTALKRRWKELCQKHHPDKQTGDIEAFRRVTHAFKMLTDAEYRHADRQNAARRGKPNIHGALDIRMMIPISFEDAFFGRAITFTYGICRFDENFQMIPVQDGEEVELERMTVRLQPNTTDGFEQLLPGQGHRCGVERGNALVVVQVLPHPRFQARGGHVHSTENVPLDMCLKGGTIEVLTMYGVKPLRIKAGTRPGDSLRIPGHGPRHAIGFGVQQKGDHIVTVNVAFPSRDELRKDAWKGLDIDWEEEAKEDQEMLQYFKIYTTSSTVGGP